jgi:hypothetical protein
MSDDHPTGDDYRAVITRVQREIESQRGMPATILGGVLQETSLGPLAQLLRRIEGEAQQKARDRQRQREWDADHASGARLETVDSLRNEEIQW